MVSFTLAAACWLAAGPGGVTVQALLACRHHAMHQSHPGHDTSGRPSDGPCFCGEMINGSDLAVSTAAPTPPAAPSVLALPTEMMVHAALFPLPPSPAFPPASPPPIRLG